MDTRVKSALDEELKNGAGAGLVHDLDIFRGRLA